MSQVQREMKQTLMSYLDSARVCETLTLDDLTNVLHSITGKSGFEAGTILNDDSFKMGEHVAAFWYEKSKFSGTQV